MRFAGSEIWCRVFSQIGGVFLSSQRRVMSVRWHGRPAAPTRPRLRWHWSLRVRVSSLSAVVAPVSPPARGAIPVQPSWPAPQPARTASSARLGARMARAARRTARLQPARPMPVGPPPPPPGHSQRQLAAPRKNHAQGALALVCERVVPAPPPVRVSKRPPARAVGRAKSNEQGG